MAASEHASPTSHRADALDVVRRLVDAGFIAYFAGGCVRDALLGLTPKDYDVATNATPVEARRLFPKSQGVGAAFGVILVRQGRSQIELATFRADGNYSDGRRPDDVRFAGPEDDARRRDFTVNGLFYDPLADRVIDLIGGVADLASRTLRAIGDPSQRFGEDYLRLLRAVRFAARFDLTIEPATRDAISRFADRLPRIAPERIGDELRAMFAPPSRVIAKRHLDALGLTSVLIRQFAGEHDPRTPASIALFDVVCDGPSASFSLALAAFAVDALLQRGRTLEAILAASSISEIEHAFRASLRLTNDEQTALRRTLDLVGLLFDAEPRVATLKRFLAVPESVDARRLMRGFAAIGHYAPRVVSLDTRFNSFDVGTIAPPPLIDGDDLQRAGHTPGRRFKIALDAAYDAQLEGRATSRDEALSIAVRFFTDDPESNTDGGDPCR